MSSEPSNAHTPASDSSCVSALQSIARVPGSVQSVYCAMYGHEPLTGAQLRESTHLPRRTVYAALQTLKKLGVLNERPSLRDTRQTYYWVAGPKLEAADAPVTRAASGTANAAA